MQRANPVKRSLISTDSASALIRAIHTARAADILWIEKYVERLGSCSDIGLRRPIPRQERIEIGKLVIIGAGENLSEPEMGLTP